MIQTLFKQPHLSSLDLLHGASSFTKPKLQGDFHPWPEGVPYSRLIKNASYTKLCSGKGSKWIQQEEESRNGNLCFATSEFVNLCMKALIKAWCTLDHNMSNIQGHVWTQWTRAVSVKPFSNLFSFCFLNLLLAWYTGTKTFTWNATAFWKFCYLIQIKVYWYSA